MNFVMLRRMRRMMFEVFGCKGRSEVAETSLRHIRRLAVSLALLMSFPLMAMTVKDDDAVWVTVDCEIKELVELYLREFPKGRHAAEARACLARIEEKKDQKDRGAELESALDEAAQDDRTAGETFRDCDACPKMVVVPAGDFMMGSPSSEEGRYDYEGPRHRVTISKPFAVGKYEVTRGEFREFMSDTGRSSGRGCYVFSGGEWTQSDAHSWRSLGFAQGEEDPVVCVSWKDAQSYVKWLSGKTGHQYRLLSESEWEYVARAGTGGPFHFGLTISTDQANYHGSYTYGNGVQGVYRARTVPVGSFPSNGYGLHDVHGNVWEWVEDCWHDSYAGAPKDGRAWTTGGDCNHRVLRGGSWTNEPRNLRAANRFWYVTGFRTDVIGFRVARTLTP